MTIPNAITRVTERTYQPTHNPHPHYEVERCITIRKYIFDVINTVTGEVVNHSTLYWKHDTNDDANIPRVYRGCSYRFSGYNPTPVTDWFHGVPIGQMLSWCEDHGLTNMRCVSEFKNVTYADKCVWDSVNCEWVAPANTRRKLKTK